LFSGHIIPKPPEKMGHIALWRLFLLQDGVDKSPSFGDNIYILSWIREGEVRILIPGTGVITEE